MEQAKRSSRHSTELSERQIGAIIQRLAEDKRVRRNMPVWGRVHIDRRLPFLCAYRRPPHREDSGTDRLILSEAAYLSAPGARRFQRFVTRLVEQLAVSMTDRFGAYLVLEVWTAEVPTQTAEASSPPGFRVLHQPGTEMPSTIRVLQQGLMGLKAARQKAEVATCATRRITPPGLPPLVSARRLRELGGFLLGLEVRPIYINPKTGDVYPLLLRTMRRQLSHVLDRTFYAFAKEHTTHQPSHYHSLGRRAVVKAVWEVDRRLADVSNSFDFLYQVTPVNADEAWRTFKRRKFAEKPTFIYRPVPIDPGLMKRALYDIHIEKIEDPTLLNLFLDKQIELDRQLTMLHDLGTKRFLYGSLQLHGDVSPSLANEAEKILDLCPRRGSVEPRSQLLTATEFAQRAQDEIARYALKHPEFKGSVQVSDEMYSGLLVSRGRLLIGRETKIPSIRADALLQHEVGTHLLTYFNGQLQPLRMLYSGLPGYDELQEGMAVLSEYLVGGLTPERLRVLAARVLSARALIEGASFADVFELLVQTYGFSQRTAYTITVRIFRGGGLLKDAVYLRGLRRILNYLADDGDFNVLFIGKIAQGQVGVIEELLLRKILKPPPLYPHYLEEPDVRTRLEGLRGGLTVAGLLDRRTRKER